VAKFLVAASKHLFVDPNFVAVTKLGTTNVFFLLLQPEIWLQQPNV